jgi:ribonuclease Y
MLIVYAMDTGLAVTLIIIALFVGLGGGIAAYALIPFFKAKRATRQAAKIIRDAEIRSEHIIKNSQLDAKQLIYEMKQEAEREIKERKSEAASAENKLLQREQSIDRRDVALISKENLLEEKSDALAQRVKETEKKEKILQEKLDSIITELEKVSQMSIAEAKTEIMARVENKLSKEIAIFIKNKEDEAKDTALSQAQEILGITINRYSQEFTTERTVSVVALPNDEMKGRIIGREGRNIRSLEQLLGVDLIIDDTPEVITVSSFDPIRREIARKTLETLIKDGRIQPSRIEEVVEKAKKEVDETIKTAGKEAAFRLGLPTIHPELLTLVGRMRYRTSYGQNAYDHIIEVAKLTGIMAAELGLDQTLAKRAGLLHDIGKAIDFEMEGSHVELGARFAKKYGEPDVVINAIESHHGDVDVKYVISNLVIAADTLSAARPGARSETLENYVKRLEQLEKICKAHDGVAQSFAMQSGREVRVMVIPEKIDDLAAYKLARDIREQIENEMTYPGQIKVSVIREYRAVETAK